MGEITFDFIVGKKQDCVNVSSTMYKIIHNSRSNTSVGKLSKLKENSYECQ